MADKLVMLLSQKTYTNTVFFLHNLPPSYRRSSAAQMGASNQSYQFSSMAGTTQTDQKPANVKKLRDLYTPDPPKPKEKKIIPGVPAGPTNNAEKKQQDAQKNAAAAGLMAMQMQKGGKGNGMVKNIQVVQQPQYDVSIVLMISSCSTTNR